MLRRIRLLLVLVVVLLLNSVAPVNNRGVARTRTTWLTGGSYQLIVSAAQATGGLTDVGYRLAPAAPAAGEGCCCKLLLPCLVK